MFSANHQTLSFFVSQLVRPFLHKLLRYTCTFCEETSAGSMHRQTTQSTDQRLSSEHPHQLSHYDQSHVILGLLMCEKFSS